MSRKHITQIFPWLLPIRKKQRRFFFYLGMRLDGRRYSSQKADTLLPYQLFGADSPLYNRETGFDMKYQENKVFNLKLAAETINRLVIRPKETFSFWRLVRYADKDTPYKEGLVVMDGELKTAFGGGLCQISNLLFWMFLHTPLTIVERHGHSVRSFPEPSGDLPVGVDAAVSEGWFDLKVRNDTEVTCQIVLSFDEEKMNGLILADVDTGTRFELSNENLVYCRKGQKVFEDVDVVRRTVTPASDGCVVKKTLYRNHCEIGYPITLGEGTEREWRKE